MISRGLFRSRSLAAAAQSMSVLTAAALICAAPRAAIERAVASRAAAGMHVQ
jgi:hypothetical protein